MKILSFDEYVNEGLINKTLKRVRTGTERTENKIRSNIEDLKPVDLGLPFLIADDDFELPDNEHNWFTWDAVEELKSTFRSNGWRLPTKEELKKYINDESFVYSSDAAGFNISSKTTDETLHINSDTWYAKVYWCEDMCSWRINNGHARISSMFNFASIGDKLYIRLVKDK